MVQRKPVDRLGIQAETKNSIKSEKKLSSQHQDVRNRGSDHLIKKMKKARSFKLSNSESKGLRKENSRFHKLSVNVSMAATPQRKPSPGRASNASSSPNYMKPTSSSDARKEGLQVTPKSQIQSRSLKGSPSSFKSSASGQKPVKLLRRNSSLKPIRPSMKKSSGIALYPKLNVGRATCSSTLKDSKFPDYVELNPGGTELEGTSVMKVCPYTYCSLNGHHHEPLPPLKRFLSAKRRLLRAQKSIKLRGISAPKKENPMDGKEIDTGQMDFTGDTVVDDDMSGSVIHLFEDDDSDFFVEIYAKPKDEDGESRPNPELFKVSDDPVEVMVIGDDEMECGFSSGREEGDIKEEKDDVNREKFSNPVFKGNDISVFLLENYDCDEQLQGMHVVEAEAESLFDCGSGLDREFPPEVSDSEASNMDWEEKIDHFSDDEIEGFDSSAPYGDDFVLKSSNPFPGQTTDGDDADEELLFPESGIGDSESGNDAILDDGQLCVEIEVSGIYGGKASVEGTAEEREEEIVVHDEKVEEAEPGNVVLPELHVLGYLEEPTETDDIVSESSVNTVLDDDDSLKGDSQLDEIQSIVSEFPVEAEEDDDDSLEDDSKWEQDEVGVKENPLALEDLQHDIQVVLGFTYFPEPIEASAEEEAIDPDDAPVASEAYNESENSAVTEQGDASSVGELDVGDITERPDPEEEQTGLEEYVEQDEEESENHHISADHGIGENEIVEIEVSTGLEEYVQQYGEESEDNHIPRHNGIIENETMEIEENTGGTEEDDVTASDTEFEADEPRSTTKALYKRRNRPRGTEAPSPVKDFNPRPPRFLPLEPDPEAEKVDLRHQMMDERKNSEEWMIDYALRQTLNKLAPARKKRVALLVEAFETVTPIPKWETHLRGSAAGFPPIRPIQACS